MDTKFYSLCSPDSPQAQAMLAARRAEYEAWRLAYTVPIDEDDRDWSEHAASLRAHVGSTERFIADKLVTLAIVDKLPKFRALIETMWHVDMYTLTRIAKVLEGYYYSPREDHQLAFEVADNFLTDYLTPKRAMQSMPATGRIVRRLNEELCQFEDMVIEDNEPLTDKPTDLGLGFSLHSFGNGSTHVGATHDDATAILIDEAVRAYAKEHDVPLYEAHAALILGNTSIKVVVNTYQANDVDDAPVWVPGHGFLRKRDSKLLTELSDFSRDIIASEFDRVTAYRVSTNIRVYIEGRDGYCRWPGCNRPAQRTEKDHRINYADGGPTTPWNMICLCSHHHNRKTDQVVSYILDPITADVYWLFSDGTWVVDEAQGPLAPANRHWVQTLAQRVQKRHAA